jgi:hypothetical protein
MSACRLRFVIRTQDKGWEPITLAQAALVAQHLGTSIEDITRDREIVRNNPKNEG